MKQNEWFSKKKFWPKKMKTHTKLRIHNLPAKAAFRYL